MSLSHAVKRVIQRAVMVRWLRSAKAITVTITSAALGLLWTPPSA
jgi:hypothetical protein